MLAVHVYNATSLTAVLAAVESPDAGLPSLRATFDGFASASEDWAQGRGCLLCNTALERATLAESAGGHVDAYFERLTDAFTNALVGARRAGELDASADVADLAAFLTMSLVGIATMAKGRADVARIQAANRIVMLTLQSHRPFGESDRRRPASMG